jgi:hypothetical protein
MAKNSRMTMLKRQREIKKAEKAARKRAKRHGTRQDVFQEPTPTVALSKLLAGEPPESSDPTEGGKK